MSRRKSTAPQLAGLEATIADQQAKLGTLSDLVHQSGAARQEQQALAATNARLTQENRLLKVGHGATFEELAARGKASTGAPYRFDELLSLREGAKAARAERAAAGHYSCAEGRGHDAEQHPDEEL